MKDPMTEEEIREIKYRSVVTSVTSKDVSRLISEVQRLKGVILQQLTEDDELGSEFSYVTAMREKNEKLKRLLVGLVVEVGMSDHWLRETAVFEAARNEVGG
jgi:hypothetical protein